MALSDVRTAWASVFADSTIQAITTKSYNYEVTQEDEYGQDEIRYGNEINFFTYITTFSIADIGLSDQQDITYTVKVNYYRQADRDGSNFNAAIDALETLYARMKAVIGVTWSSSVDYWREPGIVQAPELIPLDENVPCYVTQITFEGVKYTSS